MMSASPSTKGRSRPRSCNEEAPLRRGFLMCNAQPPSADIKDMNADRIAKARNIRRVQLDYLGSQIGICVLVFLASITLYLLTLV